ncbi:unnamed protein product [Linum tenue]|uniref:AT-hook motif nuclear-localized protein n=1 Tax=Linum tenue TaxID=586396 RepID=A0AAV0P188_9ROSI|nr:unnamed protein product [Linum tenue]
MEPDDTPHHHHHHHHHHHSLTPSYYSTSAQPTGNNPNAGGGPASSSAGAITHSPTNGLLPPPPNSSGGSDSASAHHMVYPHSVGPSSAAVSQAPVDPVRRKRGRPRKYGTPEQALAAKRTAAASSASSAREKRESGGSASYPGFSKKSHHHLGTPGNTGVGFTPHIISVAAGEDVALKINMFMQQSKSETCILSASGVIASASIRQPATQGGNITYQGRFEIISLGGSYIRSETGGRTGGLSVCLSRTDGHIIGGGLCGPLIAAGNVQVYEPLYLQLTNWSVWLTGSLLLCSEELFLETTVEFLSPQVIVGTFTLDNKKDGGGTSSMRPIDAASTVVKLPSPVGGGPSLSGMSFPSPVESTGRNPVRENDDNHQNMGGGAPFMIHNRAPSMHHMALDWRSGPDPRAGGTGYDLTGRTGGLGGHRSPENGDYDQVPD